MNSGWPLSLLLASPSLWGEPYGRLIISRELSTVNLRKTYKIFNLLLLLFALPATAQTHLDFSLTAGTTGYGFDFSMPVSKDVNMRIGASFITRGDSKQHLTIQTGAYDATLGADENRQLSADRFEKIQEFISQFSGYQIQDRIAMRKKTSLSNFKLLVDVTPFANKHWRLTAGFYYGNADITKTINTEESQQTLMGMTIWNSLYEKVMAEEPIINHKGIAVYLPYEFEEDIRNEYGEMSLTCGTYKRDIYAEEDVVWGYDAYDPITGDILHEAGDIRYHKGDIMHRKGDTYYATPGNDNMVRITQHTSKFKPYLGAGYGGLLTKDGRTSFMVEAGLLYMPTDRTTFNDGMRIGRDVDTKHFINHYRTGWGHLFPVLNLRITRRLF